MHEECLVDDILHKTYEKVVKGGEETDANVVIPTSEEGKSTQKIWKGKFDAKFDTDNTAGSSYATVTITDLRSNTGPNTWTETVACLKCRDLLG